MEVVYLFIPGALASVIYCVVSKKKLPFLKYFFFLLFLYFIYSIAIFITNKLYLKFILEFDNVIFYFSSSDYINFIFAVLFALLTNFIIKYKKQSQNRTEKREKHILRYFFGTLFVMLTCALFVLVRYILAQYGVLDFNMLLYYLSNPLGGANMSPFEGTIRQMVKLSLVIGLFTFVFVYFSNLDGYIKVGIKGHFINIPSNILNRYYVHYTACIFFVFFIMTLNTCGFFKYIRCRMTDSSIFEDYYVSVYDAEITFPEEKRNLIYIFVESMETTYADTKNGGDFSNNLIKELTDLQMDNINFTYSSDILNGAYASYGSTWTVASMVSQTSGTPLLIPVINGRNTASSDSMSYLHVNTIGEILEENGYTNELLIGSDADFGGRSSYFSAHGNYIIKDYKYAIENSWIAEDYYVFWGYEDQKLFNYAKEELMELSQSDEPFNLTILTVDTHYTDGYYCELCENKYSDQYSNVIACASSQISDFVSWISEQDFYENTTIVICGDHPTMDNGYVNENSIDDDYIRRAYTCIINSAIPYELEYDRTFSTYDMFPTTLAALGVEIEGNRLGLGTNLFSEEQTLAEIYGYEYVDDELSYNSVYYYENIMCK